MDVGRQRASSTGSCLKSLFTVAKATAPLVQISDNRAQTKGETTSSCFCSLSCSYCPVCKKIKLQSLRYIHHLTFLAGVGSVRRVCGDLEGFFWSSAYSVLKRHQEKLHWFCSFLASPTFLYWELAGGPPCRCCFNSATQKWSGSKQIASVEGRECERGTNSGSLQQLSLTLSWDVFRAAQVFQSLVGCSWRPCQHFPSHTGLEV